MMRLGILSFMNQLLAFARSIGSKRLRECDKGRRREDNRLFVDAACGQLRGTNVTRKLRCRPGYANSDRSHDMA
jgi:hypothetical protein